MTATDKHLSSHPVKYFLVTLQSEHLVSNFVEHIFLLLARVNQALEVRDTL